MLRGCKNYSLPGHLDPYRGSSPAAAKVICRFAQLGKKEWATQVAHKGLLKQFRFAIPIFRG